MLFAKTKLIATLNSVAHKPLVIGQSQIVVLCCLPVEAVVPDVLHVLNDIYIYIHVRVCSLRVLRGPHRRSAKRD